MCAYGERAYKCMVQKVKGENMVNIGVLSKAEQEKYYDDILNMLILGDEEFVPPLSSRSGTSQSDLKSNKKSEGGVVAYFEELKKQRILVTTENDKLLGFVSFKENYTNDIIKDTPNIYISTLLIKPEGRGKSLTKRMYEILFSEYKDANAFTRTWSTNYAHIKILSSFGFETIKVLKNDRGDGIDTIYFGKR